jgi:Uma2 family endonuclease
MATPARRPSAPRRALPLPPLTVEEYLAIENASPFRHEYVAGEMYAMSGETQRHNLVVGNVYDRLRAASRGGPCKVFIESVKVRVGERIYYPDLAVDCNGISQRDYVVERPCLVVEVTSPSTRRLDRAEKLDAYLRHPAIRAYLIVEQGVRLVDRHWRDERGEWQHATVDDSTDGRVPVPCPAAALTLDEIYEGIELDPPREALPTRLRRVREGAPA